MTYNSVHRTILSEPKGPRSPSFKSARIVGEALSRSEAAKMLTAMEPEERKTRIKLPALKFLDPARRLPWEPKI